MSRKIPTVAIVGRTNVGKSTLFNTLTGRRISIVEDTPGVTRDRSYAVIKRFGFPFTLIDTGGLAGEQDARLEDSVIAQTKIAIEEADLVMAVVDALDGVHPIDHEVSDLLRKSKKTVLWVVNKCEKPNSADEATQFYALGIENYVCVSAAHKIGMDELGAAIKAGLPAKLVQPNREAEPDSKIRVAVLGRPNVGKSSIINKILGEERLVASPIAGTTRDAIDIELTRDGKDYVIVDTAGLRKKAKIEPDSIERMSTLRALKALAECDVAVLVIDASEGLPSEQEARIAGLAHERGRGLIVVINKWDLVEKDHRSVKQYTDAVYEILKFGRYAPILFVSALTGRRCPSILETVQKVYEESTKRIPTSEVNKIFERAFTRKPPPVHRGQPVKLYFVTQSEVQPPTFVLFVNNPSRLNFSYERYLKNVLRDHYAFEGTDVKIVLRKRTSKEKGDEAE
jgi:GTP-binding protein